MELQIDYIYVPEEVDKLLSHWWADDFYNYYSHHQAWILRTREDLSKGDKVAIGAWVLEEYPIERKDLVGACLLKRSESLAGVELEIDLVYVLPEYRNRHHYRINNIEASRANPYLGQRLLKKAETLCRNYDYPRLSVRINAKNMELVSFYLSQGFVVQSFDPNTQRYLLTKNIQSVYSGDPYDANMITEWLCNKWGIEIKSWYGTDYACGVFKVGSVNPWQIDVDIHINDYENLEKLVNVQNEDSPLTISILTEENWRALESTSPIYVVTPGLLREETNAYAINLTLHNKVKALVVPIHSDWFEKFHLDDRPQVFMDGGEYGQLLVRAKEEYDEDTFIIFSDSGAYHLKVLGVGKVIEVRSNSPDTLWNEYGEISTFETRQEFGSYVNVKTKMTAVTFSFEEIKTVALDFSEMLKEGGWGYIDKREFYEKFVENDEFETIV